MYMRYEINVHVNDALVYSAWANNKHNTDQFELVCFERACMMAVRKY